MARSTIAERACPAPMPDAYASHVPEPRRRQTPMNQYQGSRANASHGRSDRGDRAFGPTTGACEIGPSERRCDEAAGLSLDVAAYTAPQEQHAVNAAERRGQPWTILASTCTRGKV